MFQCRLISNTFLLCGNRNCNWHLRYKEAKTYDLPRVTVAEGVISTAEIANAQELNPAITPDKFQRIIEEKYSADIMFLIQQANLRSEQLKSEQMNALHNEIKAATEAPNKELTNINVASYASPDGGVKLNTTLAENREKIRLTI